MKQERRRQNDPKKPLKAPRKGLSLCLRNHSFASRENLFRFD
jgi:hypothetical protein